MKTVGFSHFASTAPNQLALVAPDGRHWSRAELQAESLRMARSRARLRHTPPADSAEYLAMQLATAEAKLGGEPARPPTNPGYPAHTVEHLILPIGINTDQGDSLYLGASLEDTQARTWALAALDCGKPLILTRLWNLQHFFRTVQQYRVSCCYLSVAQLKEIISSRPSLARQYDLRSLYEVLVDGEPTPLPPIQPADDKAGGNCL